MRRYLRAGASSYQAVAPRCSREMKWSAVTASAAARPIRTKSWAAMRAKKSAGRICPSTTTRRRTSSNTSTKFTRASGSIRASFSAGGNARLRGHAGYRLSENVLDLFLAQQFIDERFEFGSQRIARGDDADRPAILDDRHVAEFAA